MLTAADAVFYRFNDSPIIHHNSWIPFSPAASFWMRHGAVCLFPCGHSSCTVTTPSCERIHYELCSAIPRSRMEISVTVDADRPPTGQWNHLLGQINQSITQSSFTNLPFLKIYVDVLFFSAFSFFTSSLQDVFAPVSSSEVNEWSEIPIQLLAINSFICGHK